MKILCKQTELVRAFQKWNNDVINNPSKHETPNGTLEDAELQVKELLKYLYQEQMIVSTERSKDRVLDTPVLHDLVSIFKELKFGRRAEDQKYLQMCIDGLKNPKEEEG